MNAAARRWHLTDDLLWTFSGLCGGIAEAARHLRSVDSIARPGRTSQYLLRVRSSDCMVGVQDVRF